MNDSNNNHSADDKRDAADNTETRLSKPNRNSDIYQRFLKRVQQIEGNIEGNDEQDKKDGDSNTALSDVFARGGAYEPLTEEELRLFADFEQELEQQHADAIKNKGTTADEGAIDVDDLDDNNPTDHSEHPSSADTPVTTDEREDDLDISDKEISDKKVSDNREAAEPVITSTVAEPKSNHKYKSNKQGGMKLLIIGLVCGCLLGAAAFFVLMPTDKGDSSSSPEAAATNTDDDSASIPTADAQNNAPTAATDEPTTVTSAASERTESGEATTNAPSTDPDITYDDFREEAQTTLYRETSK